MAVDEQIERAKQLDDLNPPAWAVGRRQDQAQGSGCNCVDRRAPGDHGISLLEGEGVARRASVGAADAEQRPASAITQRTQDGGVAQVDRLPAGNDADSSILHFTAFPPGSSRLPWR